MQLVQRPRLVAHFQPYYEDGLVKVITGLRRSGKSSALRLIAEDMRTVLDRPKEDFYFLNFEDFSLRSLTDPEALHKHLLERIASAKKRSTIFLDEIQNVREWEKVVNSLRSRGECDLFITGSNAHLLSSELATHLSGRAMQFEVQPFSFGEFREVRRMVLGEAFDEVKAWRDYLTWGGMPGAAHYRDMTTAANYLRDVYRAILLKDVAERHAVRQPALLEMLYAYLLEQVGHRVSMGNVEKYLKSEHLTASRDTLLNYVAAGCDAFMFRRVDGMDAVGKQAFKFNPKIYVADHGFREGFFSDANARNIDQVLENIVCSELHRRGWQLRFGNVGTKEVDFVAQRQGRKLYVQVSYLLASEETIRREFEPLLAIKDNWPKLVLSLDDFTRSSDGIEHKNLREWLLEPDD